MKKLMTFLSIAAILSGCAAPFRQGGWIVIALLGFGFIAFMYQYISGIKKKKAEVSNLIYGIICLAAAIGFYLWMLSDK
jgi:nitrate reductase NapE component